MPTRDNSDLEGAPDKGGARTTRGVVAGSGAAVVAAGLLLGGAMVRAGQPFQVGLAYSAAGTTQNGSTRAPARFDSPRGLAVDAAGNVFVADSRNHAIRVVAPDGFVTTLAGATGVPGDGDGTGSAARFRVPTGVAVDPDRGLVVADKGNFTVRAVSALGEVTTLAGGAGEQGQIDGRGTAARFYRPTAVALGKAGAVYVADGDGHTVRRISRDGVVTTLAGRPRARGSTDGAGDGARFSTPEGLATDPAGSIYVADYNNHAIRMVTPAGEVVTFAGLMGADGAADGTGSAARFRLPAGVATDEAGTVYVADTGNHTIRRITRDGVVSTLAGLAGNAGSADGAGSAARFDSPWGIAVDAAGCVYVADMGNHTVRKVTPDGVVTTLAGVAGEPGSTDSEVEDPPDR